MWRYHYDLSRGKQGAKFCGAIILILPGVSKGAEFCGAIIIILPLGASSSGLNFVVSVILLRARRGLNFEALSL